MGGLSPSRYCSGGLELPNFKSTLILRKVILVVQSFRTCMPSVRVPVAMAPCTFRQNLLSYYVVIPASAGWLFLSIGAVLAWCRASRRMYRSIYAFVLPKSTERALRPGNKEETPGPTITAVQCGGCATELSARSQWSGGHGKEHHPNDHASSADRCDERSAAGREDHRNGRTRRCQHCVDFAWANTSGEQTRGEVGRESNEITA